MNFKDNRIWKCYRRHDDVINFLIKCAANVLGGHVVLALEGLDCTKIK